MIVYGRCYWFEFPSVHSDGWLGNRNVVENLCKLSPNVLFCGTRPSLV